MKNKKLYIIPAKVDSSIMAPNINYLSVWKEKKADGVELKLPKWLWECIKNECKEAYEKGKNDLRNELK